MVWFRLSLVVVLGVDACLHHRTERRGHQCRHTGNTVLHVGDIGEGTGVGLMGRVGRMIESSVMAGRVERVDRVSELFGWVESLDRVSGGSQLVVVGSWWSRLVMVGGWWSRLVMVGGWWSRLALVGGWWP